MLDVSIQEYLLTLEKYIVWIMENGENESYMGWNYMDIFSSSLNTSVD